MGKKLDINDLIIHLRDESIKLNELIKSAKTSHKALFYKKKLKKNNLLFAKALIIFNKRQKEYVKI